MNQLKYQWILNLIVAVIAATIALQVYWNYNNYLTNKQQLINDVQASLDNAVDTYYAQIAEHNTMAFAFKIEQNETLDPHYKSIDSIISQIDSLSNSFSKKDSVRIEIIDDISKITIDDTITNSDRKTSWHAKRLSINADKDIELDSLTEANFKMLTSKVIYSMANNSLKLEPIDSMLQSELKRKELEVDYNLIFKSPFDSLTLIKSNIKSPHLSTYSKSTYLPKNGTLEIRFANITQTVLKRILLGILISTLLVLGVIACLFYLLKVIRQQKQLAEIKNDLISNITHEFKTPIATIGVALESIKSFNTIKDLDKTKNYLNISSEQLDKLNTMVEKLLETASLDSDHLELKKESVNLSELIEKLIYKHKIQDQDKVLNFTSKNPDIHEVVDVFHFENAVNNVLDNAIKYGGKNITVNLTQNNQNTVITISDDGKTLTKANKDKIFEKFYRISSGNTHDVKGFGIGLYYTKNIIEKHGGTITLELNPSLTVFKITIPHG